jgi:hypothetical protein
MDSKLKAFVRSVADITNVSNLDDDNTLIFSVFVDNKKYSIIVSVKEPKTGYLPLETIWINFNSNSPHYLHVLELMGYPSNRGTQVVSEDYVDHYLGLLRDVPYKAMWVMINTYEELLEHLQAARSSPQSAQI